MANLSTVLTGNDLSSLKTNIDAFFAANLTIRVLNIAFIAREKLSTPSLDMAVVILYDTDGATLAAPYVANLVQGLVASGLGTNIATFLATVTTQFSQGPFTDFQPGRNFQNAYTALIITNVSPAQGSANWLASSAQSGIAPWRLDVSDATAYAVGPASGSIAGAVAPAGGYQLLVDTLDFDAATDEGAYWKYPLLPSTYLAGGLTLNFKWTATAIVGDVSWRAAIAGIAAGEVITAETHTAFLSTVETAPGAADTVLNASIAFTNVEADALAASDYLQILISREGAVGGDTMLGDARLIGAELIFG